MNWDAALAAGWRVMEYRPWRESDAPAIDRGFVVVDGESGSIVEDPVVDSISIMITADGPKATVIVSRFEPDGLPLTPEKLIDRDAIMPYKLLRIGEVLIPIGFVSCVDRITKVTATFSHVLGTLDREALSRPGWGLAEKLLVVRPKAEPTVADLDMMDKFGRG
jgi:hypothetical protein